MRAPDFWWRDRPGPAARALLPFAWLYGATASRRLRRAGARAPVPVICVGNFVAGGAGKTPAALALASRLSEHGRRPVFLSRGYGGSLAGPVRVDPALHGPDQVGDEPLLLAEAFPTVVARNRPDGAALAATLGDVIVMDDGLQNPSLQKNLRLVVVDGGTGIGNGLCLPAGPLRAPMPIQWGLADAILVVGSGVAGDRLAADAARRGVAVLRAWLQPDADAARRLAGRRVLAFAGIGRPEKMFATLREIGADIGAARPFPDHHSYAADEVAALLKEAERGGLVPVTTAKDMVRLRAAAPHLAGRIEVLPITMSLAEAGFLDALLARLP